MTALCVKPARAGDVIRDPVHLRPLPPEGAAVADTALWRRRLDRGEVVKTTVDAIVQGKMAREATERAAVQAAEAAQAQIAAEAAPVPAPDSSADTPADTSVEPAARSRSKAKE